ncbi:MAG TPA: hypothetical protein VM032_15870 [Vicinamibacterales bacterium]|nr:hypothetical protein [Vicinamibacterales bacterium]
MTDPTVAEAPPAARLLITRSSARDVRNRQIFVSLDGTSIGDVLFNEKIQRNIAPGPHRLRVHNTLFWKTIEFDAAPGETVHFETVNYAGRGFLSAVMIIGVAPLFLAVERIADRRVPNSD